MVWSSGLKNLVTDNDGLALIHWSDSLGPDCFSSASICVCVLLICVCLIFPTVPVVMGLPKSNNVLACFIFPIAHTAHVNKLRLFASMLVEC